VFGDHTRVLKLVIFRSARRDGTSPLSEPDRIAAIFVPCTPRERVLTSTPGTSVLEEKGVLLPELLWYLSSPRRKACFEQVQTYVFKRETHGGRDLLLPVVSGRF